MKKMYKRLIKNRSINSYDDDVYMISERKFKNLKQLSIDYIMILVVNFSDKIMWINISTLTDWQIRPGGRGQTPRNGQDKEMCAWIPLENFKNL